MFNPQWRDALQQFIWAKRQAQPISDSAVKLGFRGWYERGYLPHYDAPNITQFVTVMLNDSFPVQRHSEWEAVLAEPDNSVRRQKLEAWLDRGHGNCWLRHAEVAALILEKLRSATAADYRLQAWVIMPNHVHFVVDVREVPLATLMKRFKGITAHDANRYLHRNGRFWAPEFFDTWVRDEQELRRRIHYVEYNPVKAFFTADPREWKWSSALHRDACGRLQGL